MMRLLHVLLLTLTIALGSGAAKVWGQTNISMPPSGTFTIDCTLENTFSDSGDDDDTNPGDPTNYSDNEDNTITIRPGTLGKYLQVTFNSFETESGADLLYVYDGPSTASAAYPGSPFSGNSLPSTLLSSAVGGELTFRFVSNGSVNFSGWTSTLTCSDVPRGAKVWNGNASADWSNANNWTPAGAPTATDDVLIPDVFTPDPIINSSAVCRNLTINVNASLTLTIAPPATFTIHGNIINNGAFNNNGTGYIRLFGGSPGSYATIGGQFGTYGGNMGFKLNLSIPADDPDGSFYRLVDNITINGSFWMPSGANSSTFDMAGKNMTVDFFFQQGNFKQGNGVLTILGSNGQSDPAGTSHVFTAATFDAGTGTTYFNSSLKNSDQTIPCGINFYNLRIGANKNGANASIPVKIGTGAGCNVVCRDLIITNPSVTDGGIITIQSPINVGGNFFLGVTNAGNPAPSSGSGLVLNIGSNATSNQAPYINLRATIVSSEGNFYMGNNDSHIINVQHTNSAGYTAIRRNNDFSNLAGSVNATNLTFYGTVDYNTNTNTAAQSIMGSTYKHLTISNGNSTRTFRSDVLVNGNVTLNNGIIDVRLNATTSYNIEVKGNWTNVNPTNTNNLGANFQERDATVSFTGTDLQRITENSFNNVVINNNSTSDKGVQLERNLSVKGILTLTQGFFKLNGRVLTIERATNDGISGGSVTAFIQSESATNIGRVQWNINNDKTNHIYPFGYRSSNGTNYYVPFHFLATSSTSIGNVSVSTYYPTNAADFTPWPDQVPSVNRVTNLASNVPIYLENNKDNMARRFWQIDVTGLNPIATVVFHYASIEDPIIPATGMRAQRWSGGRWEFPLPNQTSNETSVPRSVSVPNVTAFSPWALTNINNPLPIELLYFRAAVKEQAVELSWATAQEVNNDYFSIERSADGQTFSELLQVKGAGNSQTMQQYRATDASPLGGTGYYRLKQTDKDGKFSYSKVAAIQAGKAGNLLQVFQAAGGELQVGYSLAAEESGLLRIYDSRGIQVWSKAVRGSGAQEQVRLGAGRGLYLVTLQSSSGTLVKKVMMY
jgi:hypothetical protein